jgi:putative protease
MMPIMEDEHGTYIMNSKDLRAIDDAAAGRPFNPHLITELEGLANRGYTGGLLERRPANDYQNYETGTSVLQRSHFVGQVRGYENGMVEIETMNRFAVGDTIEVIHPSGNRTVKLTQMFNLEGEPVQVAQGNPIRVRVPLEGPWEGALIARLLHAEQA